MNYTIYKTTNNINGKYYIGAHKTEIINDNYFGSGIALKEAINKYGIENFSKEILFIFETKEEMFKKEREIIYEEVVNDKMSYNMKKRCFLNLGLKIDQFKTDHFIEQYTYSFLNLEH